MARIDKIDREEDLAFLLFYYSKEIEGITKLQKLLFLIEKETDFTNIYENVSFEFEPYKYGPFSEKVYDVVDFLLAIGAVEAIETRGEIDGIRYPEDQNPHAGKKFVLTPKGEKICRELDEILADGTREGIDNVVETYGELTLEDLLKYVYTQYEEYTTESEIKKEILK